MAHPKTIEAFDNIEGNQKGDWQHQREKGHEKATRHLKELIEKDPNKQTKVLSVYRVRVEDGISEFICWSEEITGHTGIGNEVTYYLGWDDICRWHEPILKHEIVYNPETQQHESKVKIDDVSRVITHYLYPFNKQNIKMIQDKTSSNKRCQWYVKDLQGDTRAVQDFSSWSNKDFDTLITFRPANRSLLTDTLQQYH